MLKAKFASIVENQKAMAAKSGPPLPPQGVPSAPTSGSVPGDEPVHGVVEPVSSTVDVPTLPSHDVAMEKVEGHHEESANVASSTVPKAIEEPAPVTPQHAIRRGRRSPSPVHLPSPVPSPSPVPAPKPAPEKRPGEGWINPRLAKKYDQEPDSQPSSWPSSTTLGSGEKDPKDTKADSERPVAAPLRSRGIDESGSGLIQPKQELYKESAEVTWFKLHWKEKTIYDLIDTFGAGPIYIIYNIPICQVMLTEDPYLVKDSDSEIGDDALSSCLASTMLDASPEKSDTWLKWVRPRVWMDITAKDYNKYVVDIK